MLYKGDGLRIIIFACYSWKITLHVDLNLLLHDVGLRKFTGNFNVCYTGFIKFNFSKTDVPMKIRNCICSYCNRRSRGLRLLPAADWFLA
jgi:hypothetical protein